MRYNAVGLYFILQYDKQTDYLWYENVTGEKNQPTGRIEILLAFVNPEQINANRKSYCEVKLAQ